MVANGIHVTRAAGAVRSMVAHVTKLGRAVGRAAARAVVMRNTAANSIKADGGGFEDPGGRGGFEEYGGPPYQEGRGGCPEDYGGQRDQGGRGQGYEDDPRGGGGGQQFAQSRPQGVSSNAFATGSNQNCGNFISDRPTTAVMATPAGRSNFSLGWDGAPSQLQQDREEKWRPLSRPLPELWCFCFGQR